MNYLRLTQLPTIQMRTHNKTDIKSKIVLQHDLLALYFNFLSGRYTIQIHRQQQRNTNLHISKWKIPEGTNSLPSIYTKFIICDVFFPSY